MGRGPLTVADLRIYGRATLTGYALRQRSLMDAPRALPVIRLLRSRGAPVGGRVTEALELMDQRRCMFLTHGRPEAISQSEFDEASDALGDLRALFGVEQREARRAPQVGERLLFDDSAPVLRQYDELWDLLVPSRGQCTTLQGEVIRIAGRVGYEVYNDGGVNWGARLGHCSSSTSVFLRPACRCRLLLWLGQPLPWSP